MQAPCAESLRFRQWRALKVRESKRIPQGSGKTAQGASGCPTIDFAAGRGWPAADLERGRPARKAQIFPFPLSYSSPSHRAPDLNCLLEAGETPALHFVNRWTPSQALGTAAGPDVRPEWAVQAASAFPGWHPGRPCRQGSRAGLSCSTFRVGAWVIPRVRGCVFLPRACALGCPARPFQGRLHTVNGPR